MGLNNYAYNKNLSAAERLQEVHSRMLETFQESTDVKKAEEMQKYLRYFKKIFFNPEKYETNDPLLKSLGLEEEAIIEMRQRFQQILGVTNQYNQIFQSQHHWYQNRKDFDDIVEGELNALLQTIAERATGKKDINLGQKIMGQESAIVDVPEISQELIDKIVDSFSGKIMKNKATKILSNIKVKERSGKTDIKGYEKDLIIESEIDPKFLYFINLFKSVKFSVKNYGNNKYQTIHLGNSSKFKAIYGSLVRLGYSPEEAIHIYAHVLSSYRHNKNAISRNNDIFHLRFMYELTGAGLVKMLNQNEPQSLGDVDFLIYNNPSSPDEIYVKSTKQMIKEIINDTSLKVTNPWTDVYVSKLSFSAKT